MADSKLADMISSSIESIRSIADSGTVVGDPIAANNGTVIIPVSKVSVGFASGGLDYVPKSTEKKSSQQGTVKTPVKVASPCFGGGGGTGVTVVPVCFLVIGSDGRVEMLNINNAGQDNSVSGIIDSASTLVDKVPDFIEKIKAIFSKKKTEDRLDDEKLKAEIEELDK